MEWTNYKGKKNQGVLYLPDGYDKNKSYPTIVTFYETHSSELHIHPVPCLLYTSNLDKTNVVTLLTPENASHDVNISPSSKYIVDSYSRVDMEPVNVVRDRKGKVILELEKADLKSLYAFGWKKPERFKVKAADGVTDIYGVMWKPADRCV